MLTKREQDVSPVPARDCVLVLSRLTVQCAVQDTCRVGLLAQRKTDCCAAILLYMWPNRLSKE